MAQLTATFEAGVNGNNITTGAGEASANAWDDVQLPGASTLKYDNTHTYDTLAMKATTSGGANAYAEWGAAIGGSITDHYFRFYIYITANPASSFRPFRALSTGTAGVFLLITNAGQVQVLDSGGGQIILTTNSVNLNGWSRIEGHITHSTTVGQVEVKLFNSPNTTTATETVQTAANKNLLASANQLRFGATGGDSDGSFWMDNIVGNATSYPGPAPVLVNFTNTVAPTVTGALSVGGTLTANPGTWSPTPSSFNYYWHRADDASGTNLVEITTATGSTYTIASADINKYLQAGVIPVP